MESQTSLDVLRIAQQAQLPTLATALDRTAMSHYLQARVSVSQQPAQSLTVTDLALLDCKPGQRSLLRYTVATPGGHHDTLFGKIYADANQLARVAQLWQTLWADLFGGDRQCGVAQPLGVIPELAMLLYRPAAGHFLDEMIASGRGVPAIALTAQWLAALHRSPLHLDKQFTLASELSNLAVWSALIGQNYAEVGGLAQRLFDYLQQQASQLVLLTKTPIHKDFHYRHVLIDQGVKVIDFDEMRLGDLNFDLAHFCANLQLLAYRQQGSPHHLRPLEDEFLAAYGHHTGWRLVGDSAARFTFFYLYTCLKLARQLCLGFGPSPSPTGADRQSQVRMILQQGISAIAKMEGE